MVSLIMLTLASAAWSQNRERVMSYMGDSYVLNLHLEADATNAYINQINEEYDLDLVGFGSAGILLMSDRHNLRDNEGELIPNSEDFLLALFLLVYDSASPSNISLLLVKSFYSNADIISYLVNYEILSPDAYASSIVYSYKAEQNSIDGKVEVNDEFAEVISKVKFIAPRPYAQPVQNPPEDPLVWEFPSRLRYNFDPTRLFAYSVHRTVYEPQVGEVELKLKISISDPSGETLADEIFNSVNETNITRVRFMRQIQVINEIVP
jgi:hypothetical protein